MKVTLLGTGTSTGVPVLSCDCKVCTSTDSRNKRLRTSALIENCGVNILIDAGPDLRTQLLSQKINKIDAVLITHTHADHIMGLDDLRPLSFRQKDSIKIYANDQSIKEIKAMFSYMFNQNPNYLGSPPPKLEFVEISPYQPFFVGELELTPLLVKHGKWDVIAYRANSFAYLTDCSHIPGKTMTELQELDYLVLDGLRNREHPTHMSFQEAVETSRKLNPKEHTYLTHISHEVEHDEANHIIQNKYGGVNVELGYDGLEIAVESVKKIGHNF